MRYWILFIIIYTHAGSAFAQEIRSSANPNAYFAKADTLNVDIIKENNQHIAFIQYELKPKNTLYSISKYFHVHINDILNYNPQLRQKIPQLGDILQIPIKVNELDLQPEHSVRGQSSLVPVYYQVKKGETLYTIAKVYFQLSIDEVSRRAGLQSPYLRPDQQLLVGYFNPHQKDKPQIVDSTVVDTTQVDIKLYNRFNEAYKDYQIQQNRGIAFWRITGNDNGKIYALHRTAKVGSAIEVLNPMFNTKVYAKVVGRMPKGAYTQDIMIVLSPQAAESLGALDPRFFVKVRYIE